jgi:hypothetical protein
VEKEYIYTKKRSIILEIKEASKYSIRNRKQLEFSKIAGCYYCCKIFLPNLIDNWTDNYKTAICPLCGIDAVLGDASPYQIDYSTLKALKKYWFF